MKNGILFTFLLGGALLKSEIGTPQEKTMNILLFTADDLDRNSLGCYGSQVPDISPNIDRLAREGIRFSRAYVNNSICAPSRAILATGLYGHNSGVMGFMKMEEESRAPLIMELFRDQGYQVGVLSKVDHSTPKKSFLWDFTIHESDLGMGRSPSRYYQKTAEFLESCKVSGKPFYLMVNSNDPHRPFFNPREPLTHGMEKPSRIFQQNEIPIPGFLPELSAIREEVSYYYNSVKRLDDTFGKVMQALDESGFKENTLVIFLSDNGIAFPFAKCDNYYASNRTPWIARWPGVIRPGQVNDRHFIAEVDFLPTVIEAAGFTPPQTLDGVSRWPLYFGREQENTGVIFTQIDNKAPGKPMPMRGIATPMRGVQTDHYLYIYNAWVNGKRVYANNNEGMTMEAMEKAAGQNQEIEKRVHFFRHRVPEEFYNLKEDPECLNNLVDDPAYAKPLNDFRQKLVVQMQKSNDPLLEIYLNRYDQDEILSQLYRIYPNLKTVDKEGPGR